MLGKDYNVAHTLFLLDAFTCAILLKSTMNAGFLCCDPHCSAAAQYAVVFSVVLIRVNHELASLAKNVLHSF